LFTDFGFHDVHFKTAEQPQSSPEDRFKDILRDLRARGTLLDQQLKVLPRFVQIILVDKDVMEAYASSIGGHAAACILLEWLQDLDSSMDMLVSRLEHVVAELMNELPSIQPMTESDTPAANRDASGPHHRNDQSSSIHPDVAVVEGNDAASPVSSLSTDGTHSTLAGQDITELDSLSRSTDTITEE